MWRQEVILAGNGLGVGFEGENLRHKLLERGLDERYVHKAGTTPICDVYVTEDGDRTMFGLGFSTVQYCTPIETLPYQAGAWFTAEPNMAIASREAVKMAHARGMKLYLMDFFRQNEVIPAGSICQYGTDWVGERDNPAVNLVWVQEWTTKYQCTTILTDADRGVFLARVGKEPVHLPAFPIENVVDTTGAGDAFRAGVLYGLQHRWTLGRCLRFGSAAAALKVQRLGATEHIPSLRDVDMYIERHPDVAKKFDF